MKKKINYKNNYRKKELILFMVFFFFSFFVVSGLILADRNYFLLEQSLKENISKFSMFFKNRIYTKTSDSILYNVL